MVRKEVVDRIRTNVPAIKQMSRDEKLRMMEELWESLSREETRLESLPWH